MVLLFSPFEYSSLFHKNKMKFSLSQLVVVRPSRFYLSWPSCLHERIVPFIIAYSIFMFSHISVSFTRKQIFFYFIALFYLTIGSLNVQGIQIGAVTSLYLLCCILRIVKIKDLANTISAAFFCPLDAFSPCCDDKLNGSMTQLCCISRSQLSGSDSIVRQPLGAESLRNEVLDSSAPKTELEDRAMKNDCPGSHLELR